MKDQLKTLAQAIVDKHSQCYVDRWVEHCIYCNYQGQFRNEHLPDCIVLVAQKILED